MILSHRNKFVFFAQGRTGSSSVERALKRFDESGADDKPQRKHTPPLIFRRANRLSEESWEQYFKFAFVRNPWDWVISSYLWNKRDTMDIRSLEKFEEKHFDEHVEIMRRFTRGLDETDRKQRNWLCGESGEIMVDFVGRFENLYDDFKTACDRIGLRYSTESRLLNCSAESRKCFGHGLLGTLCKRMNLPWVIMPHTKRTKHRPYTDYYTDGSRQAVAEFYKDDIEAFGYTFDGVRDERAG